MCDELDKLVHARNEIALCPACRELRTPCEVHAVKPKIEKITKYAVSGREFDTREEAEEHASAEQAAARIRDWCSRLDDYTTGVTTDEVDRTYKVDLVDMPAFLVANRIAILNLLGVSK